MILVIDEITNLSPTDTVLTYGLRETGSIFPLASPWSGRNRRSTSCIEARVASAGI